MFSNKMLYIPDFVLQMDVNTITNYFEKFEIAKVKKIEICEHSEEEYHVQGRYLYCFAIIEIDYYYDNIGAKNFYSNIENNKCKIIYNDPYYWDVEFSPYHNATKNENLIENLNEHLNERLNEYLYNSFDNDENIDENTIETENTIENTDEEDNFVGYDFSCYNKFDNDLKNKLNERKRKFEEDLNTLKKTIDNIKEKHEKLQTLIIHKNNWINSVYK